MNYGNRDGIKKVINFIRGSKITKLDIIIDNIDFFELYFEDLNYGGN